MLQRTIPMVERRGSTMLLYQMQELGRAWMAPVTYWAEANARMFSAPGSWMSSLPQAQRFAADAYAGENERLVAMLARHLEDEEDLIIPLILERGEHAFG